MLTHTTHAARERERHHETHPRGFLVQVFFDDIGNPSGSIRDALEHLQWRTVLVKDESL
jgi:hypothetical protein